MNSKEIYELLKTEFKDKILEYIETTKDPFVVIEKGFLLVVAKFLRNNPSLLMDSLMCLSGVDYPDKMTVVYHLFSTKHLHKLVLKVNTTKDNLLIPSVSHIWQTANTHEREAYDLFGIKFEGHPNLTRILLPDDWEGYPMRKDYQYPETYHGIPCK